MLRSTLTIFGLWWPAYKARVFVASWRNVHSLSLRWNTLDTSFRKRVFQKGPKVDGVQQMPPPKDVSTLRSFLGSVQFYSKFIPNMSTLAAPLTRLTRKDVKWDWSSNEQQAFEGLRKALSTDAVLAHFDAKEDIWNRLRCLRSWDWCSSIPPLQRREWKTNRQRCKDFKCHTKAVQSNPKGGTCNYFRSSQVSPLSLWKTFHSCNGSQAIGIHVRAI